MLAIHGLRTHEQCNAKHISCTLTSGKRYCAVVLDNAVISWVSRDPTSPTVLDADCTIFLHPFVCTTFQSCTRHHAVHNGLPTGFLLIRLLLLAAPSFQLRTCPICVDLLESAPIVHPSNSDLPLDNNDTLLHPLTSYCLLPITRHIHTALATQSSTSSRQFSPLHESFICHLQQASTFFDNHLLTVATRLHPEFATRVRAQLPSWVHRHLSQRLFSDPLVHV